MTKIYVVYYSMYGHVRTMANAIKEGIDSVDGCEATLFQVCFSYHGLRLRPQYLPYLTYALLIVPFHNYGRHSSA